MDSADMIRSKPKPHKKTCLLNDSQNEFLFQLLGSKCLTISTTVAELSVTRPPDHQEWIYHCSGVVCLVKDSENRSYFIRIFDIEQKTKLWELDLSFPSIDYTMDSPFFHSFNAVNCWAELHFMNQSESSHFYETIRQLLDKRKLYRTKNITKLRTKNPTKANHSRVESQLIESKLISPEVFPLLEDAGVSLDQLKDQETLQFIYNFLIENGVIEKTDCDKDNGNDTSRKLCSKLSKVVEEEEEEVEEEVDQNNNRKKSIKILQILKDSGYCQLEEDRADNRNEILNKIYEICEQVDSNVATSSTPIELKLFPLLDSCPELKQSEDKGPKESGISSTSSSTKLHRSIYPKLPKFREDTGSIIGDEDINDDMNN